MKAVTYTTTFDSIAKSILITLFLSLVNIASSGARSILDVPVTIDVVKGGTDGVTVSIIRNGIPTATIDGKRKMNLQLEFNKHYTLIFKKQNYISKSVEFDTHVSAARINNGFDAYGIGVKIYQQDEENTIAYNQAVAHISFDKSLDEFTYQTDYSKSVLSSMEDIADSDAGLESDISNESSSSALTENTSTNSPHFASSISVDGNVNTTSNIIDAPVNEKGGIEAENNSGISGNDVIPTLHSFEKVSVEQDEFKSGNMVVKLTRVTKGSVTSEYRKVRYSWGGTFYFLNNTSSISENIYALHTNVKPTE